MKHCPNPQCPDLLAHGVPGEYRDDVEACAYCGTRLEWGPPPERPREEGPELPSLNELAESGGELAAVGHFLSPGEADLARGFLETQGIPARISQDAAGGARPDVGAMTGIRLLVPASLAGEAERLLRETEVRGDDIPPGSPD